MKVSLLGKITSDKMGITKIVNVSRIKKHKIYQKNYFVSKNYKAHDPKNSYQIGDWVTICQTRPYSKDCSWIIVKKVDSQKNK